MTGPTGLTGVTRPAGVTVVTGAAGYLGRRIAARLLTDTDDRLVLPVRAADRAALGAVETSLRAELGAAQRNRVTVLPCDLRDPDPLRPVDPRGVTTVVHAAARTEFTVAEDVAHQVNVAGTAKVARFAGRCPQLAGLVVLSTLFSAGRRTGPVAEQPHDATDGFANHYEWSKHEAERSLLAEHADLPLSLVRVATVVADDEHGTVTQYNAFHNTLKLFYYGLLSLMPGDPDTPLYLADADFTARGVVHLADPATPRGIYHLAPAPAETVTLGTLVADAFEVFGTDPAFRRRRLLVPQFCDIHAFRQLVAASGGLSASPMAGALHSVAPFAEQMFLPKRFDTARLTAVWPSRPPVPSRALAAATCAELVRTRWGRTPAAPMEEPA